MICSPIFRGFQPISLIWYISDVRMCCMIDVYIRVWNGTLSGTLFFKTFDRDKSLFNRRSKHRVGK